MSLLLTFSSVSIVDFEQVNISWIINTNLCDIMIKDFKMIYVDSGVKVK